MHWTEEKTSPIDKNSLGFERLGASYLSMENVDLSKEACFMAKGLPDWSQNTSEGLTEAYVANDDKNVAVREPEIALTEYEWKT